MPINRGPFNALVDDDGSNTVGTVWNKGQIQAVILDPVDAAIAGGPWTAVPFNAANFGATGGGTWTMAAGSVVNNRYTLIGKTLIWLVYLAPAGTVAGTVNGLMLTLPNGLAAAVAGGGVTRVAQVYDAGAPVEAITFVPGIGSTAISVQKNNNTPWTPGALPILLVTITVEVL